MREWVDTVMTRSELNERRHHVIRNRAPELARREHERRGKLEKIASVRARLYSH
jgi:hypothetical protein